VLVRRTDMSDRTVLDRRQGVVQQQVNCLAILFVK
jgi:hypothetical protein